MGFFKNRPSRQEIQQKAAISKEHQRGMREWNSQMNDLKKVEKQYGKNSSQYRKLDDKTRQTEKRVVNLRHKLR